MDDLDRLFNHLVTHLEQTAPDRLFKSLQVSELYQRIIPYRAHRRQLGFESIEDYEMAVLRLLTGERDYARLEPADAQEALAAEAEIANPNPGAFREFAAATLILNASAVRQIAHPDSAYAPPPEPTPPLSPLVSEPVPATPAPPVDADDTTARMPAIEVADQAMDMVFEAVPAALTCPHCAGELPPDRDAVFCPFCGEQLEIADCRTCGEPVAPGWSYCIACGTPIQFGRPARDG